MKSLDWNLHPYNPDHGPVFGALLEPGDTIEVGDRSAYEKGWVNAFAVGCRVEPGDTYVRPYPPPNLKHAIPTPQVSALVRAIAGADALDKDLLLGLLRRIDKNKARALREDAHVDAQSCT